ncbi:hypothetical protein M9H77_27658 [Catharanthus roseus]|uniref:Uncharacterized protein n=1 Tax=Catharanthus roseus TaxID=4058 RepID=A0ACC0AF04_CATRO|nr:hypothetical protein M9H77_27658 [Catharanthus roseus]
MGFNFTQKIGVQDDALQRNVNIHEGSATDITRVKGFIPLLSTIIATEMSRQAQAPTPFEEESSNSQHDDHLRLIMQELQSLRNEMRDIRRNITSLSNQQREISPHGSLNVTTPRSNGPFNCSRTAEFH